MPVVRAATGVGTRPLSAIPFPDGARSRCGSASRRRCDQPTTPCSNAPSLAGCQAAELVPIAPPAAGDGAVVQDEREVRIAPDGETVAFSQIRRRADGDTAIVAVVGRLRQADDGTTYEVDDRGR